MAGKTGNPWPWVMSVVLLGGLAGTSGWLVQTWKDDALVRSRTLTVAAQAAQTQSDYESAARLALAAMKGHDRPFVGFDARDAEAVLAGVATDSTIRADRLSLGDAVTAVAYSPDGRYLATLTDTGGKPDGLQIRDAKTLRLEASAPSPGDSVNHLAFSSDGKTLTAWAAGGVSVWTLGQGRTSAVALTLAEPTANDKALSKLIKAQDETDVPAPGTVLALSPDEGTVALAKGTHLYLRNLASGQVRDLDLTPFGDTNGATPQALFAPDGRRLAVAIGNTVFMFDITTLKRLGARRFDGGDNIDLRAFSADGQILAVSTLRQVYTFRSDDLSQAGLSSAGLSEDVLSQVGFVQSQTGAIEGAAFSPDGRTLAVAGGDGVVRFLDMAWLPDRITALPPYHPHSDTPPMSVYASPDRRHALVFGNAGGGNTALVWNLSTGKPEANWPSPPWAVDDVNGVSGDGRVTWQRAPDGKGVQFYDIAAGARLPFTLMTDDTQIPIGLSRDRRYAFTADSKTIKVWDLSRPNIPAAVYPGKTDELSEILLSLDDRTLFVPNGDDDGKGYLLDFRTGRRLDDVDHLVLFSNDGAYFLTQDTYGHMRVWDARTRRPVTQPIATGAYETLSAFQWVPKSGLLIFVAPQGVRVWSVDLGHFIGQALPMENPAIAWIDGNQLAMIDDAHTYLHYTLPPTLELRGQALIAEVCRRILPGKASRFTDEMMAANPVLTEGDRDVCR